MSNDKIKNKLVNSMKMTKAGTAKTAESTEVKEKPAIKADKSAKKATSTKKDVAAKPATGFSSTTCRVWPD